MLPDILAGRAAGDARPEQQLPAESEKARLPQKMLDRLAAKTEGFVGAEIEQAVVAALYEAFFHQRPLLEEDLNYAIDSTVPLSVTQAESIRALRQWANVRAVAATAREDLENYEKSDPEEPETDIRKSRGGRSLDF